MMSKIAIQGTARVTKFQLLNNVNHQDVLALLKFSGTKVVFNLFVKYFLYSVFMPSYSLLMYTFY